MNLDRGLLPDGEAHVLSSARPRGKQQKTKPTPPHLVGEAGMPACTPPATPTTSRTARTPTNHAGVGEADVAGGHHVQGQRRRVSLSESGYLPFLCSQVPALIFLTLFSLLLLAAWYSTQHFYIMTGVLGFYVSMWTGNMGISSAVGLWRMRRAAKEDWNAKLAHLQETNPGKTDFKIIVIIPNYKENEKMLQETLENIGQSAIARQYVNVVLAMEAREDIAEAKAERLVERTRHLFSDVMASYHPASLPGEVAGKSSNTQWALHAAMRNYASQISKLDPHCVFVTVADADTNWHPQFFSALAYEGLSTPVAERAWTVWQAPVLLTRNYFSVPAVVRLSGVGTSLFELSGLANQAFGSHIAFSSYSMTLGLISHEEVRGWDVDVIAEDHHMFCKIYFAGLWDSVRRIKAGAKPDEVQITPRVKLAPIFLPCVAYMVESTDGYMASLYERFLQAKRHSYGVVEIGYVMLQYVELMRAVGAFRLPLRAHSGIIAIAWKMVSVHIVNTVQALSLLITAYLAVLSIVCWFFSEGIQTMLQMGVQDAIATAAVPALSRNGLGWALVVAFGPLPPIGILTSATLFVIILDLLEGRYGLSPPPKSGLDEWKTREGVIEVPWLEKLKLSLWAQYETVTLAEPTIVIYGMVPEMLAVWSLLRQHDFEYIVGAKPVENIQAKKNE